MHIALIFETKRLKTLMQSFGSCFLDLLPVMPAPWGPPGLYHSRMGSPNDQCRPPTALATGVMNRDHGILISMVPIFSR